MINDFYVFYKILVTFYVDNLFIKIIKKLIEINFRCKKSKTIYIRCSGLV